MHVCLGTCCGQKHVGFNWIGIIQSEHLSPDIQYWNYPQKTLLNCKQRKVLFYWTFLSTRPMLERKTCYIQCAFWKIGIWIVSLASWVTLEPYDFSDTGSLCRDLAVRLQTAENQNLAKLPRLLEKILPFYWWYVEVKLVWRLKCNSVMKGWLWNTSEVVLLATSLTHINITLALFPKKYSI